MSRWWLPQGRCCRWLARSTGAGWSALANGGCSRLARPELSGGHDVDLGGVQGEPRAQIQPEQQAKDDREHPVHLAGVAQVVADQVATDSLQDLPGDPSHHRTNDQLVGRDLLRSQHPERQQEQPDRADRGRDALEARRCSVKRIEVYCARFKRSVATPAWLDASSRCSFEVLPRASRQPSDLAGSGLLTAVRDRLRGLRPTAALTESVPFGKYCRSRPLVFTLVAASARRCAGRRSRSPGPVSMRSWTCWAISASAGPRSVTGAAARAASRSTSAMASRQRLRRRGLPIAGPFFDPGSSPCPGHPGQVHQHR